MKGIMFFDSFVSTEDLVIQNVAKRGLGKIFHENDLKEEAVKICDELFDIEGMDPYCAASIAVSRVVENLR